MKQDNEPLYVDVGRNSRFSERDKIADFEKKDKTVK